MGLGKRSRSPLKKNSHCKDYGRGIPLGKVIDVVSKMNTGGKYDLGFQEISRFKWEPKGKCSV
jgi:hypothetical protein